MTKDTPLSTAITIDGEGRIEVLYHRINSRYLLLLGAAASISSQQQLAAAAADLTPTLAAVFGSVERAFTQDAYGARLRHECTLENAIEFHAFAPLEGLPCVCPMSFLSGVRSFYRLAL
jgi:hypothetical protein